MISNMKPAELKLNQLPLIPFIPLIRILTRLITILMQGLWSYKYPRKEIN
ncbi:hypothetical protein M8C21_011207 [Ambrosia artemisiifolia]|uniref:Uncharacterized protein n=1 Tax=Ambrosia artemisiifolia TaxID=4212 RepID=A0AAD5BMZ4_AMBAR|nr:hypothetical protein M8C21_011207 [Ambrosia artemisiifolia]